MSPHRANPAIAWLCLIWFGLTSTLFASGMVVCRDGHGGSRIEWGCARNASSECSASCGVDKTGDDTGLPHPCDDTPVKGDHQATKPTAREATNASVLIPAVFVLVALHFDACPPAQAAWEFPRSHRPPDTLQRLRSVILLV